MRNIKKMVITSWTWKMKTNKCINLDIYWLLLWLNENEYTAKKTYLN